MPVGGARDVESEIAERLDSVREQAGLGDLDDLDRLGEALLRGLAPEGGEIRRDREGVEDLALLLLEQRDLCRKVGRAVLVGAGVDDGEAVLGQGRREVRANRVAVGVVGIEHADLLVGRDEVPLRDVGLVELVDAETEMVSPLERRGRAGLGAAAEIPSFPRHDGRQAGHARRLAGVGDRIDRLWRRDDQHQVDLVGIDQAFGELARAGGIGLGVLIENLDVKRLVADREARGERLAHDLEHIAVSLAEAAKRSGARADEADFQRVLGAGGEAASAARQREAGGARAGEQRAPREARARRNPSPIGRGHRFLPVPPSGLKRPEAPRFRAC